MSAAPNSYQRLPGRGNQIAGYFRLYRGTDHLLQVGFAGFNERYKRFYFRDIQAFIVLPNNNWLFGLTITGVAVLICVLMMIGIGEAVANYVIGGIAAIFVVIGVLQVIGGRSCRCYVRTAVQIEHLPSMNRIKRVEKLVASIQPLILASQTPVATTAQPISSSPVEPQSPEPTSPAL